MKNNQYRCINEWSDIHNPVLRCKYTDKKCVGRGLLGKIEQGRIESCPLYATDSIGKAICYYNRPNKSLVKDLNTSIKRLATELRDNAKSLEDAL